MALHTQADVGSPEYQIFVHTLAIPRSLTSAPACLAAATSIALQNTFGCKLALVLDQRQPLAIGRSLT